MDATQTNGGVTFQPRLSLAELKAKLAAEQAKLAACRTAAPNLSLSESMARKKEAENLNASIIALGQEIAQIENKFRAENETRRKFAEVEESRAVLNKAIDKLIAARTENQQALDALQRKTKSLEKSRSVSELKVTEEKQLEAAVASIGALQTKIRIADEQIRDLQQEVERFSPAYQALAKQIEKFDDQAKLDAASLKLNCAMSQRIEVEGLLTKAWEYEHKCRIDFEIVNDGIKVKTQAEERDRFFQQELERRRNQKPSFVPAPIGAHI